MDRTLRLILTMLALVAGLTSAPVQARMAAGDPAEVGRVESGAGHGLIAVVVARVAGSGAIQRRECRPPQPRLPVATIVVIPTIEYGDRARE